MRIAFTSCMDAARDSDQLAWAAMAAQQPEHIVLLGDNIYMDYGLGDHLPNRAPRGISLVDFSALMHSSFAKQWQVQSFRRAIDTATVHAIWDDHDFAWNNARGGDPVAGDPDWVAPEYRRLSRALFEQYRRVLADKPSDYPANPFPNGLVPDDLGGVQATIDLTETLRLHLLDGRSFRGPVGHGSSLLGEPQREKLGTQFLSTGVNLIASGTTLRDWRKYGDYEWIRDQAERRRLVVLSGDVHEPDFRANGRLLEATASAMAQPPGATAILGKKSEVFGLLDVGTDKIVVLLWHRGKKLREHAIDIASWSTDL